MRIIQRALVFGCLVLGSLSGLQAQAKKAARSRVSIVCSCDDATGKQYAQALHAALDSSQHFREVAHSAEVDDSVIRISIVSLPLSDGSDGQPPRSALSIVCLHDGAIIHQFVETCAHIPIAECAQSMLSNLLEWESDSAA